MTTQNRIRSAAEKIKYRFFKLTIVGFTPLFMEGCGNGNQNLALPLNSSTVPEAMCSSPGDFTMALQEFQTWPSVLNGGVAFESAGHGGILVKSYLNSIAKEHLDQSAMPYPLPQGSIFAKAVVADSNTSPDKAARVYFMKKEAAGFDSTNGDWSYGLAIRQGDKLLLDRSVSPKEAACVSCHTHFSQFDNVKTAEIYRKQSTNF